jgi:hypothetical protein
VPSALFRRLAREGFDPRLKPDPDDPDATLTIGARLEPDGAENIIRTPEPGQLSLTQRGRPVQTSRTVRGSQRMAERAAAALEMKAPTKAAGRTVADALEPEALVFTGDKGSCLRRRRWNAHWLSVREQVGLPELHFHDSAILGTPWRRLPVLPPVSS